MQSRNQAVTEKSSFQNAVQSGTLAISAELSLNRETSAEDVRGQARLLDGLVDGLQMTDTPLAWINMSSLAAASLVLAEGVDAVPVLTCRDRNRIALQSDLLGLRALGVRSLLLTRGRRVGKKHALHGSTVFDLGGRELIALAGGLSEDVQPSEQFFIGAGAKAFRAPEGWKAESLTARAEAGAQFVQTQLCFNLDLLKHWMQRLVEAQLTWRYSVMVSVMPFPSLDSLNWVKANLKDSKIPDPLVKRMEQARDPEFEGVKICAETMQAIAEIPGISGVHLLTPGDPALLRAAIEASGLR